MKKVKLFSFALAALMLGACSSEDVIDNGGQTVLPGEKGYISLGINLPTTPSSRALNDQFADGTPAEYAVKNATLIIFEGTTEADATVTGVYNLGTEFAGTATADDNITTTYQLTQQINKPAAGNNLYALVVLNKGDINLEDENLTTLEKFTTIAQTNDFLDADNAILMTNAPLYTTPGGTNDPYGGKVVTLTEINPENVFTTEAEAQANPAANVYVERALAKVTVNANADGYTPESNAKFTKAEVTGYALDVTNKTSYLVRNMTSSNSWWSYNAARATSPEADADDDYRFVGSVPVSAGLYRTYWGVDPNYGGYNASNDFDRAVITSSSSLKGVGEASYCKENTFDVENQKQDGTTRVIVAAKIMVDGFSDGESFYTLDNNKDILYHENTIKDAIKSYFIENEQVNAVLTKNLKAPLSDQDKEEKITVQFDENSTNGDLTVERVTFDPSLFDVFPPELTDENPVYGAALGEVNSHVYSRYEGGIAYYPVMIKHFGDDLTPWSAENKTSSYPTPDAEAKWLGRYGVLRNNWYDISVTSIKSIGYAEVPDVYPTFDDPVESWISVKINVLSWAKRTQNVDL